MRRFPFMQIDAFTTTALQGNPCAVVFDADDLDEATMQAIALEMNLSETSFVLRSEVADFRVRYFTPACEIPMAGHPTIATSFGLVESGRFALDGERTRLTLEMPAGIIPVDIDAVDGNAVRMTMSQRTPEFLGAADQTQTAAAFSIDAADLLATPEVVSTGTPQLMIPLRSREALERSRVDVDRYLALQERCGFFSAHLFILEGATPAGDTYARHFGVPPDLCEDPFTGSATGGMAAFLYRHGLIGARFNAEQGHGMNRPGRAEVEVVVSGQDRDRIETVKVGGPAVTVMRGELVL